MSRHRNFRNLTDDDYCDYDDDDYYDDDYYDDDNGYTKEENEAYYKEQERLQRLKEEEEAAKKQKKALQQRQQKAAQVKGSQKLKPTTKITINTNKKKATTIIGDGNTQNSKEEIEKIQLVTSMGFTSEQAKLALQKNSWDVQLAIDNLLTSGGNIVQQETSKPSSVGVAVVNKMAPPPGWGKPKESTTQPKVSSIGKGGKMAPPPGWGKPQAMKNNQPKVTFSTGGKMAPPPGWGKPDLKNDNQSKSIAASPSKNNALNEKIKDPKHPMSASKKSSATSSRSNNKHSSATTTTTSSSSSSKKKKIVMKPKKKLSKQLQDEIKGQKSRLSMVILGHVDAGKSTLMGQVCVQMGVVQKRIVDKYQKQGMFC